MKKTILLSFLLTGLFQVIQAQVSTPSNNSAFPTDYVGWDNGVQFPLSIEHRNNQPIFFRTGTGNPASFRMKLTETGKLGLGVSQNSTLTNLFTLNDFGANGTGLLFRTEGNQNNLNMWQMFTGTSQTSQNERFRIFVESGTTPFIGLRSTGGGMRFQVPGLNPVSNVNEPMERLRINARQNAVINGFNMNVDGFVGICRDNTFWSNTGFLS